MSYAPDFGMFVANQMTSETERIFLPFAVAHVSVISENTNTTTTNILWGETIYAVSIDFDQDRYTQL